MTQQPPHRRDFLHTAAGGLTAAALAQGAAAAEADTSEKNAGGIPLRKFGRTDERVTAIALGGRQSGAQAMQRLGSVVLSAVLLLACGACSRNAGEAFVDEPPTGLVFGGPVMHPALEPFQGTWKFESSQQDPMPAGTSISGGPDLTITGHILRFSVGTREHRLCQITETEDGIRAAGWHHESYNDPGDMQRVECELKIQGDRLEHRWRMVPDTGYSDDPVIAAADYVAPTYSPDDEVTPWWIDSYSRAPKN
ncbi:MAG: hypothetical protein DWQ37_20950 [Planctomycetota bacterium]|nr:MAG: hypothetical protein DWQ37_20950 [Planctomycetota bacterium]